MSKVVKFVKMKNGKNNGRMDGNGSCVKYSTLPVKGVCKQVWQGLPTSFDEFKIDYNKGPPYVRRYEDKDILIEMPPWAVSAYRDNCRTFIVNARKKGKRIIVDSMRPYYGSIGDAIREVESSSKPPTRKNGVRF